MKKTLLLLVFALCASIAYSQSASPYYKATKAPSRVCPQSRVYSTSLFTKDVTPIASVDFSVPDQGYSTGTITAGVEAHGQNYEFATWQRWPNIDFNTISQAAITYRHLFSFLFNGSIDYSRFSSYFDTSICSSYNGFMMISPFEQQTPYSGNINAFIRFDSIDATQVQLLEVSFFQLFRKYYDYFYVDYSTDGGTTWEQMEINVDGIDVSSSPMLRGVFRFTLPASAAGHMLSVRLRYKSLDSNRPSYGYFWCIDDVSFCAAPMNEIHTYAQEYVEGNYAMIPQGMTINPAWYSTIHNSGYLDQSNVQAKIFHMDAAEQTTLIDSYNNGNLPITTRMSVIADRGGWLNTESLDYRGWYGLIDHTAHGVGMPLPTSSLGDNFVFAQVASDSLSVNYDTMYYQVTAPNGNNEYRWAHDNGVLAYTPFNHYAFGYNNHISNLQDGWFVSDDADEVGFYRPGYMVTSRYTTDPVVPEDWVIHGVEIVASPVDLYHSTGAKISAVLIVDSMSGENVDFKTIYTGANMKTLTDADVNDSNVIGLNSNGYLQQGQYNTIYIPFPEQPALRPNTSFRVGYTLEETAFFLSAQEAQGCYHMAHPTLEGYDTVIYFADNSSTAKWAHHFTPNQYEVLVYDPSYDSIVRPYIWAGAFTDYSPMIRLIVGPSRPITRQNVSVECENGMYGRVLFNGEEVCGTTLTPAQGGSATIDLESLSGNAIAHLFVDGVEVQPWGDETMAAGDPNYRLEYDSDSAKWIGRYTFANIQTDHSIRVVFAEHVSVDPVAAHVRVNLQPNPASTRVNLTVEGAEGKVNCMLIDMSGRVVYDHDFNSAAALTIDVSNLGKGAYFVRITNDKFSKVEKLIVR